MPRRSKAESEATAAAILDVATTLFGEHGYAAVRTDDIAVAAHVTRGAVYHHFQDKPSLFHAVLERAQAEVGEAVADAAESVDQPWESFRTGCRVFLTACLDPARRQIMLIDGPAVVGWDAWRAQDARHAGALLREALGELQQAGLIDVPSLDAAAAMLSGAMNEATLWVAAQPKPSALTDAYDVLDVLLSSVRRED
jgi:AcrR family transcriptional regulator